MLLIFFIKGFKEPILAQAWLGHIINFVFGHTGVFFQKINHKLTFSSTFFQFFVIKWIINSADLTLKKN